MAYQWYLELEDPTMTLKQRILRFLRCVYAYDRRVWNELFPPRRR